MPDESSAVNWARWGTASRHLATLAAWDSLAQYSLNCTINYEALCVAPLREFERLFDFAGLRWNDHIRERIRHKSHGGWVDGENTSRVSASMVDAWGGDVSADLLATLMEAYLRFDLPWYR